MPTSNSQFSRIWRFTDEKKAKDPIYRSDFDVALDDITEGINSALFVGFEAKEVAEAIPSETLAQRSDVATWTPRESTTVLTLRAGMTKGDGLGGEWYLDGDDTSSPADGSEVLVDANGGRWKRIEVRKAISLASASTILLTNSVEAGSTVVTPEGEWNLVPGGSYPANGDTVRDHAFLPLQAVLSRRGRLADVDSLVADTRDYRVFAVGDLVSTAQGFEYQVTAADTTDHDLTTEGGVKLRVLPSGGELHLDAFGADPSGGVVSTMAFRAWLRAGERRGGGPMRATGLYVMGDPGDPETDDDAPACFAYQVPKTGRDSEFLLEGATLRFTAGTNKWAWRVYQHGNSALWKVPKIKGGTFECAGIVDPLGCFLWDDIGGGETRGTSFLGWKRSSGLESAICIMQRNYSSWSENNSHKDYNVHDCDRFWESGKYTGPGSTATDSIARTDLDFGFADGAKSYLIVNKMGMYDSRIRRVKGNGQKIGIIRNDGAAVAYTVVSDVSFEQGYEATSRATAEMTAGSNVLTLSGGLTQFAEWMADGMRVRVSGAGADGADLESWITGFTSNAEVTLAHPAATTVSGATSTTYATVVQEERSSLHPFTRGEGVTNRNNGRVFDDFRFTGADRSIRPSTFGALQASGDIVSTRGALRAPTLGVANSSVFGGTVTLDATDSATWATVLDADGVPVKANRCRLYVQLTFSQYLYARYRSGSLGDFGTFGGALIDELRDTDTYTQPLEVRTSGTDLQVRSAVDLAAWRGQTLKAQIERYF